MKQINKKYFRKKYFSYVILQNKNKNNIFALMIPINYKN